MLVLVEQLKYYLLEILIAKFMPILITIRQKKTERFYLRAQIARISHSTTICPKGLFRLTEDNPKEIEDNAPEEGEIVLPSTKAMGSCSMWVH